MTQAPTSSPRFHRRQDVFNFVATHLFTQGEQAIDEDSCKYRVNEEGKTLSCAGGCLIPDAEYSLTLEGVSWREFIFLNRDCNIYSPTARMLDMTPGMTNLIQSLQSVHDTNRSWLSTYNMQEQLRSVAT